VSDLQDAQQQSDDHDRESQITETNNILLVLSKVEGVGSMRLLKDFCGIVVTDLSFSPCFLNKKVFLCGDIAKAAGFELEAAQQVFVVRQLAHGYDASVAWPVLDVGRVPINVHGVGVFYPRLFDRKLNLFNRLCTDHAFQTLTESNKPGKAHRTGIYLTPVEKQGEDLTFRLLRCSSNLSGPTGNFGANDRQIVDALNHEAGDIFESHAPLNHVLAQVYYNKTATANSKQTKARIKAHADKTKDMPAGGIMAFCTFYDQLERLQPMSSSTASGSTASGSTASGSTASGSTASGSTAGGEADPFDFGYRGKAKGKDGGTKFTSGLTKLHFRLKKVVAERESDAAFRGARHAKVSQRVNGRELTDPTRVRGSAQTLYSLLHTSHSLFSLPLPLHAIYIITYITCI
jgi:hypothetical protein